MRFVSAVVAGKALHEAAVEAGYSPRTAYSIGSQIARRAHVKQSIEEQRAKLAKRREISIDKIQEEMASIAFARMYDYVSLSENGDPYVDLKKADHFQSGAISSVEIEEYVSGHMDNARDIKRVKFKLHDKQAALMNLAKLCGFIGKDSSLIDVTPNDDAQDMRELARRMVFVMQQGITAVTALPKQASARPGPIIDMSAESAENDGLEDGSAIEPDPK